MDRPIAPNVADMDGESALPRANGELVFHAPWQRCVFAMTVSLCERGLYAWDEFRDHLIAEISRSEDDHPSSAQPPTYYESWLLAFEKLLSEKGLREHL